MFSFLKQQTKYNMNINQIQEYATKKRHYFKKLDNMTLEFIRSQPYFMRLHFLDMSKKKITFEIKEQHFSRKYLELFGVDTSKNDEVHSLLKTFKIDVSMATNDFLGSYCHHEITNKDKNPDYNQYINCGLEVPYVILQRRSILLRNINNDEDLYKGHLHIWDEHWIESKGRFSKFYCVFVIDEKCQQYL